MTLLLRGAGTPADVAGGGGPITQTVALTAGTIVSGALTGASLVAAMGDASNSTYLQSTQFPATPSSPDDTFLFLNNLTFAQANLLSAITSFVINITASTASGGAAPILQNGSTNTISYDPGTADGSATTSTPTPQQVGPFTKLGGGTWTPLEFSAGASFSIYIEQPGLVGPDRIYEISLTATQ